MLTDARVPVRLNLLSLDASTCLTYTFRHSLGPGQRQARQHPLMHQIGSNPDCVALGISADGQLLAHCFFHYRSRTATSAKAVLHTFLVRPQLAGYGLADLLALHWLRYLLPEQLTQIAIECDFVPASAHTALLAGMLPDLARGQPMVLAGDNLRQLRARLDREEPRLKEAVLAALICGPSFAAPLARSGCLIGLASPDEWFFESLLGMKWPAHATIQPIRLKAGGSPELQTSLDLLLVHRPEHAVSRSCVDAWRAQQPGLPIGTVGDCSGAPAGGWALEVPAHALAAGLAEVFKAYDPGRATLGGRQLKGNLLALPEPGPIGSFRGRHAGQHVFIAASGPSLAGVNPEWLANQTVLTVNDAILKFPSARYAAVMDSRKLNELHRELHRTEAVFTLENNSYGVPVKHLGAEGFSVDAEQGVYSGYTTTYFALQIALYMGFTRIFLLGLDLGATPNRSHFFGLRPLQDRDRPEVYLQMQRSFERAAPRIQDSGVRVYNCSPVSKLKVFPFRPLTEILADRVRPPAPRAVPELASQRRV